MKPPKEKVDQLVTVGTEYIIRGQYEEACDFYNQALEKNADHYLIRKALGEAFFIRKEFLSAADNFWLAALDAAERINIDLIKNNKITHPRVLEKKQEAITAAQTIVFDYSQKTGLALFAHQYEDPLKKNTQQALINLYRHEIDPCGYRGYIEADPASLVRLEKNVRMVGYRFLKKMNQEQFDLFSTTPPLEILLNLFESLI